GIDGPLLDRGAIPLEDADAAIARVGHVHPSIWPNADANRFDELIGCIASTAPRAQEGAVRREDLHALVAGIHYEDLIAGHRNRAWTEEETRIEQGVGRIGRISERSKLADSVAIAVEHD